MSLRKAVQLARAVGEAKAEGLWNRIGGEARNETLPLGLGVGGLVTFQETPFILLEARGCQVAPPQGRRVIQAHGSFTIVGGHRVHRFYLDDGQSMLQIATDAAHRPLEGEVRLFRQLDEVHPASPEEWGFWLAEADGSIGYPRFQTADGRFLYDRVWSPGPSQLPPLEFTEEVAMDPGGERRERELHREMLYARTLAPQPGSADAWEFALLAAVETNGEAWVEIHLGVLLDPGFIQVV